MKRLRDLFWFVPFSLALGLALSLLDRSGGWAGYGVLALLGLSALTALWRAENSARALGWILLAALVARLFLGAAAQVILPVYGYDNEAHNAGFVYRDAFTYDRQAYELAASEEALWRAFDRSSGIEEQYGGLTLTLSLAYRLFSPEAHRPLLVVLLAALVSALGIGLAWRGMRSAWGERVAGAAAWVLALYPEAVLSGGAPLREPFLLFFAALFFFSLMRLRERRGWTEWAGLVGGALGLFLFSPPAAGSFLLVSGIWLWLTGRGHYLHWGWLVGILTLSLAAFLVFGFLAGSTLQAPAGPLANLLAWLQYSARWGLHELKQTSDGLQPLFDVLPEGLHLPLATAFGVTQPFLPAALADLSLWPVTFINILRSLGWYLLLPLLAFAPFLWRKLPKEERLAWGWLCLAVWVWILAASFRGGGDQWDNPRYRLMLFFFQAVLAGQVWVRWRSGEAPWFGRLLAMEGWALLVFLYFYLGRYSDWGLPRLPLLISVALILAGSIIILQGLTFSESRIFRMIVVTGSFITIGAYVWIIFFSPYRFFIAESPLIIKLLSAMLTAGVVTFAIKKSWKLLDLRIIFLATILIQNIILKIVALSLRISSNPLVLLWEENYRIYFASLLASERIYGTKIPLSSVDFSLNILNGIPFLIGNFPIWAHRLWYVLLTIIITFLTAWAIEKRLNLSERWHRWLFIGFTWLYLLTEGGVKYNLQISVIFVLITFHPRRPWRSLIGILFASLWAGLSRVNWLPVPAMLAIELYLLEEDLPKSQGNIKKYLLLPALLATAGLATAVVGQAMLATLPDSTHSSLISFIRQDLLWYRLLPNATYEFGILIPLVILSIPLWYFSQYGIKRLHPLRKIGLIVMMVLLLGGGIVVSVKIGGGSDIHNLDSYLVFSIILGSYAFFGCIRPEEKNFSSTEKNFSLQKMLWAIALIFVIPTLSVLRGVKPYVAYNPEEVASTIQKIQAEIDKVQPDQDILVMYQWPLITFEYLQVKSARVTHEYINVILIDMAMSRNVNYLKKFHNDLCKHRFGLIITELQPTSLQGRKHNFGEENDIWWSEITSALLHSYSRIERFSEASIELYIPSESSCQDWQP